MAEIQKRLFPATDVENKAQANRQRKTHKIYLAVRVCVC
jgi:hypothetical protein